MSFQDLERGVRPSSSSPESGVSAGIFQLNTAAAGFRRLVDAIGTAKDTSEHRKALNDARIRFGQLAKEISAKLKSFSDANPGKKVEEARLMSDFQLVLREFQEAQRLAGERSSKYSMPISSTSEGGDEEGRSLLWEQKRQQVISLENEIAFNEAMIEERAQGIEEIYNDVEQINEIYRDLAVLIHEQHHNTDEIDKHVENAYASTGSAKTQLQLLHKASKSSCSASVWCCWVLIILVIVLAILLIIFIIH